MAVAKALSNGHPRNPFFLQFSLPLFFSRSRALPLPLPISCAGSPSPSPSPDLLRRFSLSLPLPLCRRNHSRALPSRRTSHATAGRSVAPEPPPPVLSLSLSLSLSLAEIEDLPLSRSRIPHRRSVSLSDLVSTLLDANKLKKPIHPFSLIPRPGQEDDLFLVDSASSSFYTLFFPISQDSAVDRYAGNGVDGFSDGESNVAMFHRPRSFAVDSIGNVYVADRNNHAIRKITQSGVTTIAGGYSNTTGHTDGPAQNASFSNDFDLTFLPRRCILLISDRGNRLIRQMNLKPGDCAHHAPPGAGLGVPMVSSIGVFCSLAGLIVGFVARPFLASHAANLRRPSPLQDVEALPNQGGETSTDNLLRHHKRSC